MIQIKTGIKGFDRLVKGGLPKNSINLVCGTPGTAKTIFCLEYIYNGAKIHNEKGIYITFEETSEHIKEQAKQFKWNIKELEKNGTMKIISIPVRMINKDTIKNIKQEITQGNYSRVVIDSLSTLSINAPIYTAIDDLFLKEFVTKDNIFSPFISGEFLLKRFIYSFISDLQDLKVTALLISEIGKDSKFLSSDTVSEFLCDGIINISFEAMGGEFSRNLIVRKMRHVKNDEDLHPMEISKKGIVIHDLQ